MESRALVLAIVAALNGLVDELEKMLSADGDESAKKTTTKKTATKKTATKKAADLDDDDNDDEYTEKDIVDAMKAAQKVVDRDVIIKILKLKGKAARATEVEPGRRGAVIVALEAAIDDAA